MNTQDKENKNQTNFSKADFENLTAIEKADLFVQGYRIPQKQSKAATLDSIRQRIAQQDRISIKPVRNLRVYWSVAASVALLVVFSIAYFYFQSGHQEMVVVDKGQHLELALPDGSEIKVNADSKVTYSATRFKYNRELELVGEAFFSVKKGSVFVVKTPIGRVEVLGTTLNVFSRENIFNVSCHTGKVRVSVGLQSITILPGEKVSWTGSELRKSTFISNEKEAGWTRGKFSFDNIPLNSIFDEIERQFNVDISATGIDGRFYSGSFSNTKLSEVLETVCLPMNLEYEIKNGNHITIKPKSR